VTPTQQRILAALEAEPRTAVYLLSCLDDDLAAVGAVYVHIADVTITGTESLPEGKVTLKAEFTPNGTKEGGGTLKLFVDDKPAGEGKLTRSSFRHSLEPFEVGRDSITTIDPAYRDRGEFPFAGTIEKVTFELLKK